MIQRIVQAIQGSVGYGFSIGTYCGLDLLWSVRSNYSAVGTYL